jgi:hypothetical protein
MPLARGVAVMRQLHRMLCRLVLLLPLLAGCLATPADPTAGDGEVAPQGTDGLAFEAPVQVNPDNEGFEPSLRVGPEGNVYVAAARGFLTSDEGELASPVWRSSDGGATWQPLQTPLDQRERVKGIEGDLAVDGAGNVYFLDTWGGDNVLTSWSADGTFRSIRPLHGTLGLDDRPWLAAQGDGILYALTNTVAPLPPPTGQPAPARFWLYASLDGGATWTLGTGFPAGGYCHVAASPIDVGVVAVACIGPPAGVNPGRPDPFVDLHLSEDYGASWVSTQVSASPRDPAGAFPSITFGTDGRIAATWVEADGRIGVVLQGAEAWGRLDIEPETDVASPWVATGPNGSLAVAAYAAGQAGWRLDAWRHDGAAWMHAVADDGPLGELPPADFFQCAFAPDGLLHIAHQDNDPLAEGLPTKPDHQPVLHVRQRPAGAQLP